MNKKTYAGRIPDESWSHLGKCVEDGMEWGVYAKPQDHSDDWVTYKIVANGRVASKANYWMARNCKTGKIGFARDYLILQINRPRLFEMVDSIVSAN